jgi:hypothetical protein
MKRRVLNDAQSCFPSIGLCILAILRVAENKCMSTREWNCLPPHCAAFSRGREAKARVRNPLPSNLLNTLDGEHGRPIVAALNTPFPCRPSLPALFLLCPSSHSLVSCTFHVFQR